MHLLTQSGDPCVGLEFTYTDPSNTQITAPAADASGNTTVDLTEAGSYHLNSLSYLSYHFGPGSLSLGTLKQSDLDASRVFDFYIIYNLDTQKLWTMGPVPEDTGSALTSSSVVGSWTLHFQWSRRSQGKLDLVNYADGTFLFPGGQPGDGASDVHGTWSISGNGDEIAWVMEDGTVWLGGIASSTSVTGSMETNGNIGQPDGNTGTFTGARQ
jgi:hypothetical protein